MFNENLFNKPIKIFWTWFVWSNVAYNLSRTWFKYFFITDPDEVKEHNLLNQFLWKNIWINKAQALKNELLKNEVYPLQVLNFDKKLEEILPILPIESNDIVLIATDSLESRISFLENILENYEKNNLSKTTFLFVNTNNDVIYISINIWDKKFLETMKINLSKLNSKNSTDWLCWEKSAFYLWSLISWYIISEIRKTNIPDLTSYTNEVLFNIKTNQFNYDFIWHWNNK